MINNLLVFYFFSKSQYLMIGRQKFSGINAVFTVFQTKLHYLTLNTRKHSVSCSCLTPPLTTARRKGRYWLDFYSFFSNTRGDCTESIQQLAGSASVSVVPCSNVKHSIRDPWQKKAVMSCNVMCGWLCVTCYKSQD